MSTEPTRTWTNEELLAESVSKKDILGFLHANASNEFLIERKLNGKLATLAKNSTKPTLIAAYDALFESKSFRAEGEEEVGSVGKAKAEEGAEKKVEETVEATVEETGPVRFKKQILKKGDKVNFPKKGDVVQVWYTGSLVDGKVFDSLVESKKRKTRPLKFKVGTGRVIRGWDEGLLTMSKGEKAKLTIEPEWAYGKKGLKDAGIAPDSTLIFEVELISIN